MDRSFEGHFSCTRYVKDQFQLLNSIYYSIKNKKSQLLYFLLFYVPFKVNEQYNMNEDSFHLGIKALIRNQDAKVLLLKVNIDKFREFKGEAYWDIPGGRIHKGHTIEDTLKREVEEETGINTIKSFTPFHMVLSNLRIPIDDETNVGLILSAYICDVENVGEIKLSEEEHTEAQWFAPQEASKLLETKYPKEFTEKILKLT